MIHEPLVQLRDVYVSYKKSWFAKETYALHEISFTVQPGSIIALIGQNGAGKSTLLKLIAGLLQVVRGHFFIGTQRIAYVPQENIIPSFLTAYQIMLYVARLHNFEHAYAHDKIGHIFEQVNLTHCAHDKIVSFSKGMHQRLMIAQALFHDPELLLLDEPFSNLDYQSRKIIEQICFDDTKNRSIIYASHEQLAVNTNLVMLMDKGKIEQCTPNDFDKEAYDYFRTRN
jgi:ABC-2 type transport system ATP-binding protein